MNLSEVKGTLKVGDEVEAVVDNSRAEIEKHHSATHLLHAALREILGDHIAQAGSLNDDKRLRFDFSHPQAMSTEEIAKVEAWVNDKVLRAISRKTEVMSPEAAKNSGAIALFGEKYGDEVRGLSMSEFSVELCGGTHVTHTGDIGLFKIVSESGIAAGVRRIEAVTGETALNYFESQEQILNNIAAMVKADVVNVSSKVEQVIQRNKQLEKEIEQTRQEVEPGFLSSYDRVTTIVSRPPYMAPISDQKCSAALLHGLV